MWIDRWELLHYIKYMVVTFWIFEGERMCRGHNPSKVCDWVDALVMFQVPATVSSFCGSSVPIDFPDTTRHGTHVLFIESFKHFENYLHYKLINLWFQFSSWTRPAVHAMGSIWLGINLFLYQLLLLLSSWKCVRIVDIPFNILPYSTPNNTGHWSVWFEALCGHKSEIYWSIVCILGFYCGILHFIGEFMGPRVRKQICLVLSAIRRRAIQFAERNPMQIAILLYKSQHVAGNRIASMRGLIQRDATMRDREDMRRRTVLAKGP